MILLLILAIGMGLCVLMAIAWSAALYTGKSGWIDAFWSFGIGGFGMIAALAPIGGETFSARQFLVAVLVMIWSLRLGLHIARRTMRGGDDPRYAQLRQEWGAGFRLKLFWFLQIQAAVGWVLVGSILVAARNPGALRSSDWIGVVVLALAIGGETIADRELARFGADPAHKGQICKTGLWGFSRHPNYFFEWLAWLAYVPIAINWQGIYPWGWFAVAGPILMYWLLVHASGIPPLEAHMLRSRGDAFRVYQAEVNAFWPGPPRKENGVVEPRGKSS